MKKLKLFIILTTIFCLFISMVGCGKVETKQSDSEVITETINTTAKIQKINYTVGSDSIEVAWILTVNVEYNTKPFVTNVVDDTGDHIEIGEPVNLNRSKDISVISYESVKQYKKYKKIFNNKEEVKVTLVINRTLTKDGDYTTVSRKVIPDF